MRVTIKDVAKRAEVSTATVSNVLTGAKYVGEELKIRIENAMNDLGYQPNVVARSLKINRTMRIGVIVPDITNPFFSEIVKRIDERVSRDNYQLIVCNSEDDIPKEKKMYTSFIKSGGVDGLVMVAPRMGEAEFLGKRSIPLIIVDRPPFSQQIEDLAFIYSDNYLGASYMASLFIRKKYECFACIGGPESVPNANARFAGFCDTLVSNGVARKDIIVRRGEFNFNSGYDAMEKLLDEVDCSCKRLAVFVSSDIAAWGAIEAANARALKIPEHIGVGGYDNIYFSKFIHNGLTTIDNPKALMGEKAGTYMLQRLQGDVPLKNKSIILDSALIERKTV